MQRHRPTAATGLQCATDCIRSRGHPLEGDRKVLVLCTLTDEFAAEVVIIADCAADHGCALERIETESALPNRHESMRRGTAGYICRYNRATPSTLQAVPAQNTTGLEMFAQIRLTSAGEGRCEQPKDGHPESDLSMV